MDFQTMTDAAISEEIGRRLKELRLRKNWTQKEIADFAGLSLQAIQNTEKGQSTMATVIKILRPLKALDTLNNFIPELQISPIQLMKLKGKTRQRARKQNDKIR